MDRWAIEPAQYEGLFKGKKMFTLIRLLCLKKGLGGFNGRNAL